MEVPQDSVAALAQFSWGRCWGIVTHNLPSHFPEILGDRGGRKLGAMVQMTLNPLGYLHSGMWEHYEVQRHPHEVMDVGPGCAVNRFSRRQNNFAGHHKYSSFFPIFRMHVPILLSFPYSFLIEVEVSLFKSFIQILLFSCNPSYRIHVLPTGRKPFATPPVAPSPTVLVQIQLE